MFEFIGMVVVAWLGYHIIRIAIRSWFAVQSMKTEDEVKRIATEELEVPSKYFSYVVSNKIEAVKYTATALKNKYPKYKKTPWEMYLALSIKVMFAKDCDLWEAKDAEINSLFRALDIDAYQANNSMCLSIDELMQEYAK